jgi:hypothetical protein
MNVFDIWNMCCIFEIDCSEIDFLRCHPTGIALNPQEVLQGHFEVAIQNEAMEIRLWEATTRSECVARLANVSPCCGYPYGATIARSRSSSLIFTPKYLMIIYCVEENTAICILLDAKSL